MTPTLVDEASKEMFSHSLGQERSVDRVWFGDGQAVAVNLDIEPAEDMRWVDPTHPAG